jgi:hypothetical protein
MSIRFDGAVVMLEGDCRLEDAERLAALLDGQTGRPVDLSQCRSLHAAVLQALLWYAPDTVGAPADPFLRDWIAPSLQASSNKDRGPDS